MSQDPQLQGFCPDCSSLPDVSGNGSFMSPRSLGRHQHGGSASQQPQAAVAATAAGPDAGSDYVSDSTCAARVNAVNVAQAGAFPVRHGSSGVGMLPTRTLTHEHIPASRAVGLRRSLCRGQGHTNQLSIAALPVASTALQLTGSTYCSVGGSSAGECEHFMRSRHSSASSGSHKDVTQTPLNNSHLSESNAAPLAADSDGDSLMRVSALKPKHSATLRLGTALAMLACPIQQTA